jgi:hypothetical protein
MELMEIRHMQKSSGNEDYHDVINAALVPPFRCRRKNYDFETDVEHRDLQHSRRKNYACALPSFRKHVVGLWSSNDKHEPYEGKAQA